jgi:ATP-dependent exoDNAse (exonuclease V) alpha subunit
LGRIARIGANSLTAEFDGVTQDIDRSELDRIELAYCISVHKAQGSQFANVIMPVTQSFNFDRTMLYTGLTRAVSRVGLDRQPSRAGKGDYGATPLTRQGRRFVVGRVISRTATGQPERLTARSSPSRRLPSRSRCTSDRLKTLPHGTGRQL